MISPKDARVEVRFGYQPLRNHNVNLLATYGKAYKKKLDGIDLCMETKAL